MEQTPYDKIDYTWVRHLFFFMIKYPLFRSKLVLYWLQNSTTHICYKGDTVERKKLKEFLPQTQNLPTFRVILINHAKTFYYELRAIKRMFY